MWIGRIASFFVQRVKFYLENLLIRKCWEPFDAPHQSNLKTISDILKLKHWSFAIFYCYSKKNPFHPHFFSLNFNKLLVSFVYNIKSNNFSTLPHNIIKFDNRKKRYLYNYIMMKDICMMKLNIVFDRKIDDGNGKMKTNKI